MRKKLLMGLMCLVLAFSLFGCGNDAAQDDADQQPGGTIKVVATNDVYAELFDKFTEETGVKVDMLAMSSGDVLSKLLAEGGTPSADLWFGGGIDAFMSAAADGLLSPVNFAAAGDIAPEFRAADGSWYSKGITVVGFLVNNKLLQELKISAPESWESLTESEYEGEIIMANPAISGTNYAVINAILQAKGEEDGWEYLQELDENIAYYARRGSDPANKVIADEFAIGITYIDNSIEKLTEEYDVSIIYPEEGMPWVPEGVAVLKNSANEQAAAYFIEWLFSNDENLQLLAELDGKNSISLIKPNMTGAELDYDATMLLQEDLSRFGTEREAILKRFEALMGDKAVAE